MKSISTWLMIWIGGSIIRPINSTILSALGIEYYASDTDGIGGLAKKYVDDFVVHEITPWKEVVRPGMSFNPPKHGGLYSVFVLEKRALDTFGAMRILARQLKVPLSHFGAAGLKDAYGHTFQLISIWNVDEKQVKSLNLQRLKLYYLGRQTRPLKIGFLWGNQFNVWIRDCPYPEETVTERIHKIMEELSAIGGFFNYFDLQRFGTGRPISHLVGKYLLLKEYELATRIYLGIPSPVEPKRIQDARKDFYEGNMSHEELLKFMPGTNRVEISLLRQLSKAPRNFLGAWQYVGKEAVEFLIGVFQSYLFNRILSEMARIHGATIFQKIPYLPIPGYGLKLERLPEEAKEITIKVLESENISIDDFYHEHKIFRRKGTMRFALAKIHDFSLLEAKPTPENCTDVLLSFSLKRGIYAVGLLREFIKRDFPIKFFYNEQKRLSYEELVKITYDALKMANHLKDRKK